MKQYVHMVKSTQHQKFLSKIIFLVGSTHDEFESIIYL